jgi:hypothetical protein
MVSAGRLADTECVIPRIDVSRIEMSEIGRGIAPVPSRIRRALIRLMLIAPVALAAFLGFAYWRFARSHARHLEWYRDIEDHIIMLAANRPDGIAPGQWAYCLSWTWQLHSNCGDYAYFDHAERARFLAEFDHRLAGRVDFGTIDWIWDVYVEHSTCGRDYSRSHRPTKPQNLRDASTGRQGDDDLREWLDRLKMLQARKADAISRGSRAAPQKAERTMVDDEVASRI